jgi:two-component system, cell cycle response regulator DivK
LFLALPWRKAEAVIQQGAWNEVSKRILVVEDNELNLKLFCDLLRAHGHEADPVRDAREAIGRANEWRPDIIVMDIQMPHISGLELIEHIRLDITLRRIPIMAVTAYAGPGDEERIKAAGADAYVSKPITLIQFMEVIKRLSDLADSRK